MRTLLLNLFAILLLPHAFAQAPAANAKAPAPPAPVSAKVAPAQVFELTPLQAARLDAERERFFRWSDKMQESLHNMVAICDAAEKENKWPPVQCSVEDLTVTLKPVAAPAAK
jgi:hypothetical protein